MNKSRKNPGLQSLCPPLPSVKTSQVFLPWPPWPVFSLGGRNSVTQTRRWVWMGGNRKRVRLSVSAMAPQSVEKRSPAEGSGARPPVTLGRRERSGRLWMWDLSSFLTWVTRASFCLYSCRHQTNRFTHSWLEHTRDTGSESVTGVTECSTLEGNHL